MSCRMRKLGVILLICATTVGITGCWDRKEISDLAIVLAIGIDVIENDQVEVTLQFFAPLGNKSGSGGGESGGQGQKSQGGSSTTINRSGVGVTVSDAIHNLQKKVPRNIFLGHNEVYILGEKLASKDLREPLDYMLRETASRERADVFICEGRAKNVLKAPLYSEASIAQVLRAKMANNPGMSKSVKELADDLLGDSGSTTLPYIKFANVKEDKPGTFNLDGLAIVKDNHFIAHFNEQQAMGLLWIRNKYRTMNITLPTGQEGYITLQMMKSRTRLKPAFRDEKWTVNIDSRVQLVVDQNTTSESATSIRYVQELELRASNHIQSEIKKTLEVLQHQYKVDVLDIHGMFYKSYPNLWRQKIRGKWETVYPNVNFDYKVRVDLVNAGMEHRGGKTKGMNKP
ncbi:Ger(x)C family spore germination protein [Paenibacillus selenitireducens]|uniref:Ger(x)C family spore germination protein n=1 Tax=Paenibacillus selenitireducens TaxID=1324314 RepID=UPI001301E810|nr:Ger(x)C family spore germination protein [Paenibacillus selenitireducens]